MPGNLSFPSRWLAPLWLASCCLAWPAEVHKVAPRNVTTFAVAGATAAYSLDGAVADATAEEGMVSLSGKQPGSTHIVVITPLGEQTVEVLVTTPPPQYPPGFVMPASLAKAAQSGYYEGRYYSSPAQIQNQLQFSKIDADNRTHVHVVETNLLGPLNRGQPRSALSSASYQIVTPRRDITFIDQYVDESPLTLNGSIVRGIHVRQDNWFVHAGYSSVAAFQGLFLPTRPELVAGGGYRFPVAANSSITTSFYGVRVAALDPIGQSGNVGSVSYKYNPRENFWFVVDAGVSRGGIAGAGRLHYRTGRDAIAAVARYIPLRFASLGVNNFRGLHADFSWTRHVAKRFDVSLTFYHNNLVLPEFRQTTISDAVSLRYRLTRHWALNGGAIASKFQMKAPPSLAIRSFTIPAGLAFQSQHFGASAQYQFAASPGREKGNRQYRGSVRSGWGPFAFTGHAERDTNAPTLSFILSQMLGLQQVLQQQGIRATTIQQVSELLSSNSFLISAGYIKGATINLVPVRTQIGGTADWSSRGAHRKQFSYGFLFSDNQMLRGSTQDVGHSLFYSHNLTRDDDVSLGCSVLGTRTPGDSRQYAPICFVAWRHQFHHVPNFIVPERHGTISGSVFRDDLSKGILERGMQPMPEVEIMLDNRRRALTLLDGSYRFSNVPRGKHRITAIYRSGAPFFFTTPSDLEVDEDATANFGIGHSLSGLMGQVLNDAGKGVAGVSVAIRGGGSTRSTVTGPDGRFFVAALAAGDYDAQGDEDSLPAGYAADGLVEPQRATVGASSPGKAIFIVRAFRSISGRVLGYDPNSGRYVPVNQAQVVLQEAGLRTLTDLMGRYLFRDLGAGLYTLSVQYGARASSRTVRLSDQPIDLVNVDFQISAGTLNTAVPEALPVNPQPAR